MDHTYNLEDYYSINPKDYYGTNEIYFYWSLYKGKKTNLKFRNHLIYKYFSTDNISKLLKNYINIGDSKWFQWGILLLKSTYTNNKQHVELKHIAYYQQLWWILKYILIYTPNLNIFLKLSTVIAQHNSEFFSLNYYSTKKINKSYAHYKLGIGYKLFNIILERHTVSLDQCPKLINAIKMVFNWEYDRGIEYQGMDILRIIIGKCKYRTWLEFYKNFPKADYIFPLSLNEFKLTKYPIYLV